MTSRIFGGMRRRPASRTMKRLAAPHNVTSPFSAQHAWSPLQRIRHRTSGLPSASLSPLVAAAAALAGGGAAIAAKEPDLGGGGEIPFEQIARAPRPGLTSVGKAAFTPDGKYLVYLRQAEYGNSRQQLYATELATGVTTSLSASADTEGSMSKEEKMRRERARIYATGVTNFLMGGNTGSPGQIVIPISGGLWVREGPTEDAPMRQLVDPVALGGGAVQDPTISKDGQTVCFVFKNEIYYVPMDGSASPKPVTQGAESSGMVHGLPDYLAQESLGRYEGYWISPDSKQVVYEEYDEKHIPIYHIIHQGTDQIPPNCNENHHYPFAGKANPTTRLYLTSIEAASTTGQPAPPRNIDLTGPFGEDLYINHVQWGGDGAVLIQVFHREQTELAVLRADPASGAVEELFREKCSIWVNAHPSSGGQCLKPIGEDGTLLWASERTGHRHLYIYTPESKEMRPITSGVWQVDSVVHVDTTAGYVCFLGTATGEWLDKHLYRVSLKGPSSQKPVRLTDTPGIHTVTMGKDCFVDVVSSKELPSTATLRSTTDGTEIATLFKNEDPQIAEYNLDPPEFVTLPSTDGKVTLQGMIYKPDPGKFGPGPYPCVVSCYGGPHVQFCANVWPLTTMDLRAQSFRSRGFLVLKVDNRGSNRRGLAFEGAVKNDMGNVEVEDQAAGVRWAIAKGLADPNRVAIYGWSYGGYLSLMCLTRGSSIFQCAVSGAPVTNWDGYDSCYTERYMDTPPSNPKGYEASSVMTHVDKLKGDLLLIHGLIDENVHFRHTARLISALVENEKPYHLILLPNERHGPRSAKTRQYVEENLFNFINKSLNLRQGPSKL